MEELIKGILMENAGGVKFMELYTRMCVSYLDAATDVPSSEGVLQVIQGMDGVGLLKYVWPMSKDLTREKYFVYFK